MKSYKKLYKIAVTTGDKEGIGFEVTTKALARISQSLKKSRCLFFIFRHVSQEEKQPQLFKTIDKKWRRLTFYDLETALNFFVRTKKNSLAENLLVDLALRTSEAEWVAQAALACKEKKLDALITGPISKKVTSTLPHKPLGHTGIFRQLFPDKKLHMSFIGKDFNVVLATDHQPLAKIEAILKKEGLADVLANAQRLKKLIGSNKKIALLGFNPHSGEGGLIGDIEKTLFLKLSKNVTKNVIGPLVPDAAFLKKNWKLYSVFVCLYHDQGLIPFKMHHGQDSGVHLTLGLPFVRTSVDHGTAADLFNKNVANANSMLEAIKLAMMLTTQGV